MLTQDMIDGFVDLAGPGYMWEGVRGSSRPASDVRSGLRDDLLARQGGICPVCGTGENGQAWEFNHVVSRGPMVKGFVRGNIFAGHSGCNASTKPIYDNHGKLVSGIEALPVTHFKRADLIPLDWTPTATLRKLRVAK